MKTILQEELEKDGNFLKEMVRSISIMSTTNGGRKR